MSIVSDLRDRFGSDITATEVKKYAREAGLSYPTVTRHIEQYKVKRGTWNLTVQEAREQFEQTVAAQNLVPAQDSSLFLSATSIVSRKS